MCSVVGITELDRCIQRLVDEYLATLDEDRPALIERVETAIDGL